MAFYNKKNIKEEYRISENDTGSAPVQIALLSSKINHLAEHFAVHKKDKHSKRGFLMMIERRRKLSRYYKAQCEKAGELEVYKKFISSLGLRK